MSGRSPRWIHPIQKSCLVEYSGTFSSDYAYVMIDGVKYTEAGTQTVNSGDAITIYVSGSTGPYRDMCYITLDGVSVQNGHGKYEYTARKKTELVFGKGRETYYFCDITTS